MQSLPAGLALHRTLLRRQGDVMGGHGYGERPIGQRDGLLAPQGIDRVECLAMREEHLVERFAEILQEMEAVGNLGGRRGALACALGIGTRAIPRDDLYPGMLPEPLGHGVRGAIRQQGHGLAALQINEHGARGLAFPQGKIIHTEHSGGGAGRDGLPAKQAQQGVAAQHHVPRVAELHPSLPPKRPAEGDEALHEPQRAPRPGGSHRGQPFGEDTTLTGAIAAQPLADAPLQGHPILGPGQVRQGAPIVTMDASGWGGAQRTGCVGLRRLHAQGDLRRGIVDVPRLEAQRGGIR